MALPARADLPWYVAPLPKFLEDLGLRFAWLIVAINLAGTAFGFYYYWNQFQAAPVAAWPLIPDSPVATMFIGLSLAAYKLDIEWEWLHALAFFGCLKLGFWTPFVQLFVNGQGNLFWGMYWFLILSHLAMVVEAFVIHRYATVTVRAVAVAAGWYLFNDIVDYFVPILGGPHHTWLRAEVTQGIFDHNLPAHDLAGGAAVTLTVLATFLALATRVKKLETASA